MANMKIQNNMYELCDGTTNCNVFKFNCVCEDSKNHNRYNMNIDENIWESLVADGLLKEWNELLEVITN